MHMLSTPRYLSWVCLFFCLIFSITHAQNSVPIHPVDGEYITDWLVLGPFNTADIERDFLADAGGESNINPKPGDTLTTVDGRVLTWKRHTFEETVELTDALGYAENATAYVFCLIQSSATDTTEIRLGSEDKIAIWLNGERVYVNSTPQAFASDANRFEVKLRPGENRCLVKVTQNQALWPLAMQAIMLSPNRAVIEGIVTDSTGNDLSEVQICLENEHSKLTVFTDSSGRYRLNIYPVADLYDLSATAGELGIWHLGLRLREGDRRTLDLVLKRAISVEGKLQMLDNQTPHVGVSVQAVKISNQVIKQSSNQTNSKSKQVVATVLSDAEGNYHFINLKPGQYQVRCYTGQSRYVHHKDALEVVRDKTLSGIDVRFASFKKGIWKIYTTLNGLLDNTISAIHLGSDGSIWFASGVWNEGTGGVSRFDGMNFENFSAIDVFSGYVVTAIHRTPDGVMWFGGNLGSGLWRYDGEAFVNFTTADGLAGNSVQVIEHMRDGSIWVGTDSGVSHFDGTRFTNYTIADGLAGNIVADIHEDADGVIWFATSGGVSRYDGVMFKNLTTADGLIDNRVLAIENAPDGVMWFGTGYWDGSGGLSRYDGESFVNFTTTDGLINPLVYTMYRDSDGLLWIGTDGGVSCYDGTGFVNFTTADGLASSWVRAIAQDESGMMWFGTEGGGISRYDGRTFAQFTTVDGLANNEVLTIARDNSGRLLFGTRTGVSRLDGTRFTTIAPELSAKRVLAIKHTPEGEAWFGTIDSGVFYASGKEYENLTTVNGLPNNHVLDIEHVSINEVWFATYGGASLYDGETFVNFTDKDGLVHNRVFAVERNPSGGIWFGTAGGLSYYDGEAFVNFTESSGLANRFVRSIYRSPDDVIWLGTSGGVSQYDGHNFVNFTTDDGLAYNGVNAIHQDIDGVMWFGTDSGVSGFDGTVWTSLDTRDGLLGNRIGGIEEDSEGFLWFGTDGGVTRYRRSHTRPSIRIVSVRTDQLYSDLTKTPSLTARRPVTIECRAIDLKTVPEKRQYQVKVSRASDQQMSTGKEKAEERQDTHDALHITKQSSYEWTPKEAGTYRFEVQAIDRDLNDSEPAHLMLKVVLPWYLNGWVVIPSGGGILALLISSIFFGTRSYLHRREAQRLRDQMLEQERRDRQQLQDAFDELQQTQAQLIQSEKMAGLGTMVAGVAHEINNPINFVYANMPILEGYINDLKELMGLYKAAGKSKEIEDFEQEIDLDFLLGDIDTLIDNSKEGAERVRQIVLDLRKFARQDTEDMQEIDIHEGIESTLTIVHNRLKNRITVHKEFGKIPEIRCYPGQLNQVFMNLLTNAADAIEGEGDIWIKTWVDGDKVKISVRDNGYGIPDDNLPKIFDPFVTTKPVGSGTGLGLAVSHQIIERHGGSITVDSEVDRGTQFTVILPVDSAKID